MMSNEKRERMTWIIWSARWVKPLERARERGVASREFLRLMSSKVVVSPSFGCR